MEQNSRRLLLVVLSVGVVAALALIEVQFAIMTLIFICAGLLWNWLRDDVKIGTKATQYQQLDDPEMHHRRYDGL